MLSRLIDKPWKLVALLVSETAIFFVALWYSIPIVAGNEAVYNGITILWLALSGSTIYLYGDVTKKPKFHMMGFALMLFIIFFMVDRYEGYAVKVSAYAALLVAFAAFVSINENRRLREDNRRIREEVLIQERHRLALERIRYWAEEAITVLSVPPQNITLNSMKQLSTLLQPSRVKAMGILTDCELLGGELQSVSAEAHNTLLIFGARLQGKESIAELRTLTNIDDKIEPISTKEELGEAFEELFMSLQKVITSATKRLMLKK